LIQSDGGLVAYGRATGSAPRTVQRRYRQQTTQTGRLGRSPSIYLIGHRVSQVRGSLPAPIPGTAAQHSM
jgi:hypothetical protein